MVKDHYKEGGSKGFDRDRWRVFVLCKFDGNMDLKSGTNILQYNKVCRLSMNILLHEECFVNINIIII